MVPISSKLMDPLVGYAIMRINMPTTPHFHHEKETLNERGQEMEYHEEAMGKHLEEIEHMEEIEHSKIRPPLENHVVVGVDEVRRSK
jgi:hypothetical protein